ncbi:MAG: hypothetical protein ACD_3C00025G0008 [uncultured bacterium (gcode 4)]|uniref:Integral membrane protein n=1 Tax=uncultured bacterium (gcode 4) TaxID=1234023 RepID=K2GEP8_9BACT|nr:MAG: hypothetical protein ACD_3C00025G0008 [uncultured bacterium (gcode 4)]
MKKTLYILSPILLFLKTQAHAMCPVCTVAAAAWIELSHYLGVDDSVTWIWIWWMLVSVSMWTINWFDKKNIRFFLKKKITYILYYASVIIPLYYQKLMFVNPANKLWWIDKLFLWIIIGTILFYATAKYYLYLKAKNWGHPHFPMQKIAMSMWSLTAASLIFYYITSYIYAI